MHQLTSNLQEATRHIEARYAHCTDIYGAERTTDASFTHTISR